MEWADVRETDLTKEQVDDSDFDRDYRGNDGYGDDSGIYGDDEDGYVEWADVRETDMTREQVMIVIVMIVVSIQ